MLTTCHKSAGYSVERYAAARKAEWNDFLAGARNATFLFHRDYMEYHSDRFTDHSLMVFDGGKLAALLPANRSADDTVVSHEGLTYGGLVVPNAASMRDVLSSFHAALAFLNEQGIAKLLYKRIPAFYNAVPDDEIAYALFLLDARLYRRDCAVAISQADRFPFQERRRRAIRKAAKANVRAVRENTFAPFWELVLTPRLESRYGVKPVHTVEEITLLASRFPENIKQFSVYRGDEILAGTTIYETPAVAHAQYIAVTNEGQKIGALDFLFGWLMDEQYRGKRFVDLGVSNEKHGRVLNQGLQDWKEGFGGRSYVHDFYEVATVNCARLEPLLRTPEPPREG